MSGEVQPASILVDSIYLQKCRPIHVNQQISCPLHPQQRLAYNKRLYVPCRAGRYSSLLWTSYRLSALWVHMHHEWLFTATEIKSCHRAKTGYHCSCNSLQHLQQFRQSTAICVCGPRTKHILCSLQAQVFANSQLLAVRWNFTSVSGNCTKNTMKAAHHRSLSTSSKYSEE